jgi:hypothetical protein
MALYTADLGDFVKVCKLQPSLSLNPMFNQLIWWRLAKLMAGRVRVV